MKDYYVYILANKKNGTLYTGMTNNIQRRMYEHKHKLIDGFSKKYGLNHLVHLEICQDVSAAIAREKQIKGWKREKKVALIESRNPTWKDLCDEFGFCFESRT
ncbi:Excinuclease ABC C subunit domain protein [Chloroherpeton thalassium ATCC 35110]|uniref:Excinuclease ABC C subunit domain protein n=1 Tax=Chloroherpeton thalassium (strain ATCC 35110 / GB-78) TaxID=517418 RepID=B3QV02_CHLT3|nr:GIY-YIG nuclease family protein [Chloroherpeton thalassium]ACF14503.1 Excinuclease ABC C subunit domain protein [Chloroherpeton thalassium ATCC 35110]